MLLEANLCVKESTGLLFEDTLSHPDREGIAHVRVSNPYGFTGVVEEGTVLGEAVEAVVIPLGSGENAEDTGESATIRQSMRRMPFAVRQEVAKQLKQMQANGIIEPLKSLLSSPVVLVRKKDGSH